MNKKEMFELIGLIAGMAGFVYLIAFTEFGLYICVGILALPIAALAIGAIAPLGGGTK